MNELNSKEKVRRRIWNTRMFHYCGRVLICDDIGENMEKPVFLKSGWCLNETNEESASEK